MSEPVPVLLVIDDDPRELATFERALRRRYGADYRVIAERSPEAGLERLAGQGDGARWWRPASVTDVVLGVHRPPSGR